MTGRGTRPGRWGVAFLVTLAVAPGCTYYNSIYNAERLFADAEVRRRAGDDSLATTLYRDVIRTAARGFRREPSGPWAYEASFLIGRAHLRNGDLRAARAALSRSVELARDPNERLAAQVYVGMIEADAGRREEALRLFNQALAGADDPTAQGEGHLHRARILLERGNADQGWWDLDRAAAVFPPLRVEATLERLRWGIRLADLRRTAESVTRIFSYPEAAQRHDTVTALLRDAEARWNAALAADFLEAVDRSVWPRDIRDRIRLEHASALFRAGRPEAADRRARQVAAGRGPVASQARLQVARWTLARAQVLEDAYRLRPLLLPASGDPDVESILEAVDELERLAFAGLDTPLAWFAAAELARDRLGAPEIAAGLFLAYANTASDEPWAPKALLAAMDLTDSREDRAVWRGRLEPHAANPYVLAARGMAPAGFEALEEELLTRLNGIRNR